MADREKLIELLWEYDQMRMMRMSIEECVDKLIANGVTFATDNNVGGKWIPVTERLPEDTLPRFSEVKQIKVLTALKSWNGLRTVRSQMRYRDTWCKETRWMWKYSASDVTHWMPLPEPPKGECV